ncbi:Uncharacterized conserved protein, DUF1330 family [Paenibacillus algorifonticola]|uniref:Uncharacterized conserved protein, DUF1330 family n=1 Tax=Paenibacillus algorifonticola TaxID=684063 RepID=A0A1I2IU12_9BACL|nr:DUF1330 domain-containing protein [Paenibacillus algorifonticola]SFF45784.1 Uncharacterized conserved protein, DUF1330 family [Paenibacillus algorifonticola]
MSAYLVIDIDISNPVNFKEYENKIFDVIAHFGGRPIVHDNNVTTMEGDWQPKRLVILEFPNKQSIEAFFNSEMYEPLKKIRRANSTGKAIVVEGL